MLDFDYPRHYAELTEAVAWKIRLPESMSKFFAESGIATSTQPDQRATQRRIVRMKGLLTIDRALPMFEREHRFIGVYTSDFSKDGCGLISPSEWFPEERIRLVLPTFWLTLQVSRCEKLGEHCYRLGTELLGRRDPERAAFIHNGKFLRP